jgi:hypothetical protein
MHSVTADRAFLLRDFEPRLRKYASVAGMAIQRELASRAALLARLALYGVLLLIFSKLWAVVA